MNPLEQMIEGELISLLDGKAEVLLTAYYTTGAKLSPAFQNLTPTAYIDGQLKHWVRGHLGFLGFVVDGVWTLPNLRSAIDPLEAQVVASEAPGNSASSPSLLSPT